MKSNLRCVLSAELLNNVYLTYILNPNPLLFATAPSGCVRLAYENLSTRRNEGKRYCVLHFPGKEKSADFSKALQRQLDDKHFNFRGVWFPDEVLFSSFDFSAEVDFSSATFSAAAYFHGADFSAKADFSDAIFSANLNLGNVTFGDYVNFSGSRSTEVFSSESSLDLQFATVEKPGHLSFHTVALRPHWFVNVDPRKFEFTNVEWTFAFKQEIRDLRTGRG